MNGINTNICHHIRESVTLLALRILVPFILIEILFGILIIFLLSATTTNNFLFLEQPLSPSASLSTLAVSHLLISLLLLTLLIKYIIGWAVTEYYLTERELIVLHGIVKIEQNIYDLSHTRTVKLHRSWFGKVFNYGTVDVILAGSGYREDVRLSGIVDPEKYENIFRKHIQEQEDK